MMTKPAVNKLTPYNNLQLFVSLGSLMLKSQRLRYLAGVALHLKQWLIIRIKISYKCDFRPLKTMIGGFVLGRSL